MKLRFWGAAQTVTGSMHEVEVEGRRYLLDCGLRQGPRRETYEINSRLPFAADTVQAVILSHAHIDHTGNLPTLEKNGFTGPVYATPATKDLCAYMLADSAHLQQKDVEFLEKRHHRRKALGFDGDGLVPALYSPEDAREVLQRFRDVPLHQRTQAGEDLAFTYYNAGHMLGSACVLLESGGRKLLFSGDVGRKGLPIIHDPEAAPAADYLIMESTYGDRLHQLPGVVEARLEDLINRTVARGGHVIVPAFAVGRTQQLVLMLHQLIDDGKIGELPIFVDSPLAVDVTDVFRRHTEEYDEEAREFLEHGKNPFGFARLRYLRTPAESKTLNDLRVPYIVISASGMCEAGRILHHLRNGIEDPRNLVLITGYQAENTLGRRIVDGQREVRIFGEPLEVRAQVAKLNELSGHADQRELLKWMKPLVPGLKHVFLVHGEPQAQAALVEAVREEYGLAVSCPARGEEFTLQ